MSARVTGNASSLVDALEGHFQRYLAIDPKLPLVLALWSLATHVFEVFDAFPYLAITSPAPRCGKTRAAELLELFCAKPTRTVGITVAALFRTIERDKPTLIIDEAEHLRGRDERTKALLEILNAGYRKGQKVRRCEGGNGKNWKLRDFETYCPKVVVLIGFLNDTLADRTIPVQMRRRKAGEKVDRFLTAIAKRETAPLQNECKAWAKGNRRRVKLQYESAPDLPFLQDREAELWVPLFAVCTVGAPERLPELESAARNLAAMKAADEPTDLGTTLLADVREVFDNGKTDRLPTALLLYQLTEAMEDSPWPTVSHGKALNPHGLSRFLRPFRIQPKNIRDSNGKVVKGYERSQFEEAWELYLPPPSSNRYTATEAVNIGEDDDSASATEEACSGPESAPKANNDAGCSDVADENQTGGKCPRRTSAPLEFRDGQLYCRDTGELFELTGKP